MRPLLFNHKGEPIALADHPAAAPVATRTVAVRDYLMGPRRRPPPPVDLRRCIHDVSANEPCAACEAMSPEEIAAWEAQHPPPPLLMKIGFTDDEGHRTETISDLRTGEVLSRSESATVVLEEGPFAITSDDFESLPARKT